MALLTYQADDLNHSPTPEQPMFASPTLADVARAIATIQAHVRANCCPGGILVELRAELLVPATGERKKYPLCLPPATDDPGVFVPSSTQRQILAVLRGKGEAGASSTVLKNRVGDRVHSSAEGLRPLIACGAVVMREGKYSLTDEGERLCVEFCDTADG